MSKFSKQLLRNGSIAVLVGSGVLLGVGLTTQAQNNPDQDQNTALQAVAKMTEGQRTYYQKNGKFRAIVKNIQKDFGITLPSTFNYAVRTTSEAAF
jgi:CHASE3 domain sensor protein